MSFQYYWFLSCLYHDIGYALEERHQCAKNTQEEYENLKSVREDGIEALHEICHLRYVHNRVFKTYSKGIVDFYLKCRASCLGAPHVTIDHGIAGGLLLYDNLRKQFAKAWKARVNRTDSRAMFHIQYKDKQLFFSNEDYKAYAKAADAIITHNIWRSTLEEYFNDYSPRNPSKNNPPPK